MQAAASGTVIPWLVLQLVNGLGESPERRQQPVMILSLDESYSSLLPHKQMLLLFFSFYFVLGFPDGSWFRCLSVSAQVTKACKSGTSSENILFKSATRKFFFTLAPPLADNSIVYQNEDSLFFPRHVVKIFSGYHDFDDNAKHNSTPQVLLCLYKTGSTLYMWDCLWTPHDEHHHSH